jgi:hypothetical protein
MASTSISRRRIFKQAALVLTSPLLVGHLYRLSDDNRLEISRINDFMNILKPSIELKRCTARWLGSLSHQQTSQILHYAINRILDHDNEINKSKIDRWIAYDYHNEHCINIDGFLISKTEFALLVASSQKEHFINHYTNTKRTS